MERLGDIMMDGLILPSEVYARPKYIQYLRKYRMPCVIIGYGDYIPKDIYSVTVDTNRAMREIIGYLRGRGHSRIAFVSGEDLRHNSARYKGFNGMMRAVYGENLEQYVLSSDGGFNAVHDALCSYGVMAADMFAQRKLDATAVVCFNDDVAVGFCHRITRLGYRIPEDLSIVSFDGLATGKYTSPALTSMGLNPFEHGRKCAEMMISLINGVPIPCKAVIEPLLIERESVRSL
jgi:DNA-binding LacI/PurR family transcriptional regulator